MMGNVLEWIQDIFHQGYDGAPTNGSAWEGTGTKRVLRGCRGLLIDVTNIDQCRSASRGWEAQGIRTRELGFRLVMEINPVINQT